MYYYIGILKKLSALKLLNFIKLLSGYYISRISRKPFQWGLPFSVSVEPTTSCNLRCPQCPSGLRKFTRETGMLEADFFNEVILQLKRELHSLTFYFQGEPYLNPDFLNMVKTAGDQGIYTITSTNAHYMTAENAMKTIQSGLDKLIISVDGITQEVYEKYRAGGQLTKVIEGTKEIVKKKAELKSKHPYIVWQFVVFKHNEHQVEAVKRLGNDLGVDKVMIKTAQIYEFESGSDLIPEKEAYSRYKKDSNGKFVIKNKLLNQCWRMWQGCVITWNGSIVPCCFDKDAHHKLGELQNDSFKKIWFSSEYRSFRSAILKGRSQIEICRNCTEGTKVWTD